MPQVSPFLASTPVELEGEQSPDEDFDADEGALLIRPTKVVDTRPLDRDRIGQLRRDLGA